MRVCDFCLSKTKQAKETSIFMMTLPDSDDRSENLVDADPDLCSDCRKKTRSALKKLIRDLKKKLRN